MVHRLIMLVLLLLGSVTAYANEPEPLSVQIVEYGIFKAETKVPATGSGATMKASGLENICHVMTTTTVPARDNINFGFRYRINGPATGTLVDLKKVVVFPDHTRPADSEVSYIVNEAIIKRRVGAFSYTGWTNYQTRPGQWTFRLFHADRKLVEMGFTVVDASEAPVKPDGNSTCFLLSGRGEHRTSDQARIPTVRDRHN